MTNQLTATGLTKDTLQEIINKLTQAFQDIYGADINVESNSPDGQLINILALTAEDILNLLNAIYASFDVDQATGTVLDERVALINIRRLGATYSFQDIEIITDRAVNLQGLDADANNPDGTGYTVSDAQGNQFILLDSQNIPSAGTYTFSFRAKNLGAVEASINTITIPITIILGVLSVNNPTSQSAIGQDEETDFQLRERFKKSSSLNSKGSLDGVLANLLDLEGVINAKVYENFTNSTDANGIPPHSMYAIVEGGSNQDIAQSIAANRSVGCNMLGDVEVDVEIAMNVYTMKFDRPSSANLFIRFGIKETKSGQVFDEIAIKQFIVNNKAYKIGEIALADDLSDIARSAILSTAGNVGSVINLEISSDGLTWDYFIEVSQLKEKWVLSEVNITITIL